MFAGITNYSFDDPDFKEDSVRELILTPMLSKLGYLPSARVGRNRYCAAWLLQIRCNALQLLHPTLCGQNNWLHQTGSRGFSLSP